MACCGRTGRPSTSADVLFTYTNITPKYVPVASATFKSVLQKVEAPDPSTIKLTLAKPYGPFRSFLNVPIVPAHLYDGTALSSNPHNRAPIGTGPFSADELDPERLDDLPALGPLLAVRPAVPGPDLLKIIPQGDSRIDALKAGEVDYLPYTEVVPQDVASLKDDPSFQWATGLTSEAQVYLTLNLRARAVQQHAVPPGAHDRARS